MKQVYCSLNLEIYNTIMLSLHFHNYQKIFLIFFIISTISKREKIFKSNREMDKLRSCINDILFCY